MTDDEIVRGIKHNDPDALRAFVQLCGPKALGYLINTRPRNSSPVTNQSAQEAEFGVAGLGRSMNSDNTGGDPRGLYEDAMQNVLVRIHSGILTFNPSLGHLKTWGAKVIVNAARDIVRAEMRKTKGGDNLFKGWFRKKSKIQDGLEWLRNLPVLEVLTYFHKAILMLSPQERAIIQADFDARGTADSKHIAEVLGTNLNTIYKARCTGRKKLHDEMKALATRKKREQNEDGYKP